LVVWTRFLGPRPENYPIAEARRAKGFAIDASALASVSFKLPLIYAF
jgi:hypothetical protein